MSTVVITSEFPLVTGMLVPPLADEPTGSLDGDTRDEIIGLLDTCGASAG
jgi:predicted ABC-type transport system involved in lysophospholipase L1 biosynthesis ATPase subunit